MDIEQQFRNRLNSLLEGIQIIDWDFRYIYLNDVMTIQSRVPKEELLGHTMMEKFPGIEDSPLFEVLSQCMKDRTTHRIENQFNFPDGTSAWFDLNIQPAQEGVCILSLDITQHKISEQKITKSKELYAFLSHINQSIVHLRDASSLYRNACKVAVEFGKFQLAWVAVFDEKRERMTIVEQCGVAGAALPIFRDAIIPEDSSQRHVIETGTYHSCGDVEDEVTNPAFLEFAAQFNIKSFIIMPLRREGAIIGTLNLYSDQKHFTGDDEILLLQEVAGDLSFALSNFEREKKHRETERIVLENEKRFRALIEKSADMKTLATADGKLFYGSPSISKVLGYDLDKMVHASLFDLIHPDDVKSFAKQREKLVKKPGASFYFEARMKHCDGHWVWCEGTATNMLEESGVNAIVSNFRDISEKKRVQQQIEFDRDNMFALINNTEDLMWSIDKEMNLITANSAFDKVSIKIYGSVLQSGEKILRENLSPERRDVLKRLYQRALSGESFRETVKLELPGINWSEISFNPIINDNEIIGTACHSRDITERIKTEIELEHQNKQLLKTNFELDRFVYSVSHDLRSPLTSILGLLSFIEEESKEPETLGHAAMIRSGINRLDGFIKNILSYSRTNRTEVEITQIPVSAIAREIVTLLRNIKNAENIDFLIDISENKPFYSDRQGVYTIIENIISNAIKFQKEENDYKFIRISGETSEAGLSLKIEDNGIGIPEVHHSKIFDMFFRAEAKIDGSGIGLYIVREIVTKLKGMISVSSQPGEGTAFDISLKNLKP